MFFYLCTVIFSGFLEFRGNFVDGRNNSKYREVAPLRMTNSKKLMNRCKKRVIECYHIWVCILTTKLNELLPDHEDVSSGVEIFGITFLDFQLLGRF